MRKPLIYISGCYTAPTPELVAHNVLLAKLFAQAIICHGAYVFCPHLASHGLNGLTHEEWLELDKRFLTICDAIYMLPDWEKSVGARDERTQAMWLRLPIFYHIKDLQDFIARWKEQTPPINEPKFVMGA